MNNQEKLTFIEGTFNDTEAKEILLNVFTQKINFHQMKNFSSQERFGKVDATASKRIIELKKGLEQAMNIVDEAKKNNLKLNISSDINITISN
jgi:DNA-directed RNA polymerase subunit F